MSGVNINRVQAGAALAIRAADWNSIGIATERVLGIPADQVIGVNRPPAPGGLQTVLVRNDSTEDIPRFGWLGLVEPIFDPTDTEAGFLAEPTFVGTNSTIGNDWEVVSIAVESIPAGKCGRCVIRGTLATRINVVSKYHTHATYDRTSGEQLPIRSAFAGPARILWKEDGVGEGKRAIVDLDPHRENVFLAQITGYAKLPGYLQGWAYSWVAAGISDVDPLTAAPAGGLAFNIDGGVRTNNRNLTTSPVGLVADGIDVVVETIIIPQTGPASGGPSEVTQKNLHEMLAQNVHEISTRLDDTVPSDDASQTPNIRPEREVDGAVSGITNDSSDSLAVAKITLYPRILPIPIDTLVFMHAVEASDFDNRTPVGRFIFSAINPHDLQGFEDE